MRYNIFLDDERVPSFRFVETKNPVTIPEAPEGSPTSSFCYPLPHSWTVVRSYEDFCKVVTFYGLPLYISFDHDLGEEKNGLDCARFLVDYCLDNDLQPTFKWYCHSQNPVGAQNINGLLEGFVKACRQEDQDHEKREDIYANRSQMGNPGIGQ